MSMEQSREQARQEAVQKGKLYGALGLVCGCGAVLLLIVGVFHTGWCYSLFFGSMTYLPAQTVVLFSYIDPIVAIFLSALLLKEPLGWSGILGAVLVLGSTLISELPARAAAETK